MSDEPALAITPFWARFNDNLIRLVDLIPPDKMNWSPRPELWNFRGILLHIAATRDNWLTTDVRDGEDVPSVWTTVRSPSEIQGAYRRTWQRLERFLAVPEKLAAIYSDDGQDPDRREPATTGHWIAFHLLEHDIHHRADVFHYLALLGIATPDVGTP